MVSQFARLAAVSFAVAAALPVEPAGCSSGPTSVMAASDLEDDSLALLQKRSSMQTEKAACASCASRAPPDSAFIVIDMQYDFINGSLAVDGGADIISTINELAALPGWNFVAYTMDFHPPDHISFAANHPGADAFSKIHINYTEQGLACGDRHAEQYGSAAQASCSQEEIRHRLEQTVWPVHCVQHSVGGRIHHEIVMPEGAAVTRKGYTAVIDSYGAFHTSIGTAEGNLKEMLHLAGVKHVYVVGLAMDYCVKYTSVQAAGYGFDTTVVLDATKQIAEDTGNAALEAFEKAGVKTVQSSSVAVSSCDDPCE